ncbi:MAG: hypothetical protein QOF02_3814 [Blastocatellia bacterium]|nr:hypothetical protein [Blastocatellia bacterium]
MPIIIYIALMVVLLLACSIWAMGKKDKGAQGVFAGAAGLIALLLVPLLRGEYLERAEFAIIFVVDGLLFVAILLFCYSLIGAFNDK